MGDIPFREVASNMLIHREYASGATSRLIIEYGRVVTDNPSRPHGFGLLNPETAVPFQKNPILSAFFREIDRADELGSGMRKMMLYGKKYGGDDPQLIENDNFRMVISVPEFGGNPAAKIQIVQAEDGVKQTTEQATTEVTTEVTMEVTTEVAKVMKVMDGDLFRQQIQERLGLKNAEHLRKAYLVPAMASGLLEMTIPDKPNSRLQKYRLTAKGRKILENMNAETIRMER